MKEASVKNISLVRRSTMKEESNEIEPDNIPVVTRPKEGFIGVYEAQVRGCYKGRDHKEIGEEKG